MNFLEKVRDWYITKKTGLTREERRIREWYDSRINYRGIYIDEIYHGFDYVIEVDPFRVLNFANPFGWDTLPEFKKYQHPELPLEDSANWAWVRGVWENNLSRRRYCHNEIGGGDNLFVITNSKQVAAEVATKFGGTTSPSFEEEIANLLATELQKTIDWEILKSIFESNDWHRITLKNSKPSRDWLKENIQTPYHASPSLDQFVFQDKQEATMFALRWS